MSVKSHLLVKIPRRASECAYKKELFLPGSEYLSYILFDDEWKREDYCLTCWQELEEKKKEEGGNYWIGKIPPKTSKKLTVDEKALRFFIESVETKENPKLLYVLALYLERNKQIVRRQEVKETQGHRYFEILETGELLPIESYILSEEEGVALAIELSTLLSNHE